MDLHEEYHFRHKIDAHLVKHVERGNLILRAKDGAKPEWNWLHATFTWTLEPNHPGHYQFLVSANPVIYASPDFNHFTYHHTKVVQDERWEWEQYEDNLINWAKKNASQYVAIPSTQAIFVSWELFSANYDSWMATFFPTRVAEWLFRTFDEPDIEKRLDYIKRIEEWIQHKYQKVFMCWKNIRNNLEKNAYADWLAAIVNSESAGVKPYTERDLTTHFQSMS